MSEAKLIIIISISLSNIKGTVIQVTGDGIKTTTRETLAKRIINICL
jgi:hypothetical protein